MSQTNPPAASCSNYQAIFDGALEGYKKKTGKDLTKHPLLHRLETCNSPDAVLTILQTQILEPGQSQSSRNRLTMWLGPTVNVLNAFSSPVGALVGQVSLPGRDDLKSDIDFFGGISTRGRDLYRHRNSSFCEHLH